MFHESAVIETKNIGEETSIGPFCVIARDVTIGARVIIHPHVVIGEGVSIADEVEIFPGAYLGKAPKGAGALARQPIFERQIRIGRGTSIGPSATIYYDVTIGRDTLIGDGASIRERCTIGDRCIISRYVTINYNSKIGNRTKIMDMTHITGNCMIGDDVFISTGVSTVNDNAIGKAGYNEDDIRGPIVHDGAAVGANATLLPGIVIERNAIVGSGSVVTKNVAPWTLVMGAPARFVRKIEDL
ncbi:acyltransferase [Deinococcus humi]|uniref:Acetyltransferase-like isoleucine patch superfamily enzyme n=1 Tax=Deinococcus humi TaxID=662880 RepID=A0A7W8NEX7_9DEIO|nr:acyltransferase [Deinococcus humi]MBB5361427.1 acetyltransferase-like isoleucine patch superfamily enzyme [Deinococcus humi]GGO20021.1 acyltransferase [Deinococcus humi]